MKRALIPGVLVLLLVLTACSGGISGEQAEVTPAGTTAQADAQSTEADKPLTAETPAASTGGGESAYLSDVRAELPSNTIIPNATDEQLLEAGMKICDLKAQGANPDDWTVIEGEQRSSLGYYNDSAAIAKVAVEHLCS